MSTATPPLSFEQDQKEQLALWNALLGTVQHFFGGVAGLFHGVSDPRHPAYITYSLPTVLWAGVLLFLCRLGARRQIALLLRNNGGVAAKFAALFELAACPHGDTLNALCKRLDPAEMQESVTRLNERLIRNKVLDGFRLLGIYFVVAIDGTQVLTFAQRHCPHCLTRTQQGQTVYYHPVLEAKLVLPNGFTFSLLTEFIENAGENPSKQDCELKAFARLSERLKQRFPRLPLCLSLDALFACGPVFARCAQYGWQYMIVLKAEDLPKVHQEFEALARLSPADHLSVRSGPQGRIQQELRWVNEIAYVDSERREHRLSVLECRETKPGDGGQLKTTRFLWVSSFTLKDKNVLDLANQGGRIRWQEENQGFNVQKNGGFALEHPYSQDYTAAKNFYFLLQMAHLLGQLLLLGSLLRRAFPKGLGSAQNLARRLLEVWRNLRASAEELRRILSARFQIRFDSS